MKRLRVLGLGILFSVTAATVGARGQQSLTAATPIQMLTFRLQRNRLVPARLTVPEGRYAVTLINTYVLGEIELVWKDSAGAKVAATKAPKGNARSRLFVQLTPGQHVLQVLGDPTRRQQAVVILY
ncbi:MAG TPA: hypothetical protein VN442_15915 [Bryobacteraceae bacterium]|nr:hypothetical protein [Bryobacteraceae bacterium]